MSIEKKEGLIATIAGASPRSWLLAFAACTLTTNTLAQNTEKEEAPEDRWYQVEVVLVAHRQPGNEQEIWRNDIALAYPPNWVTLKDPEALKAETLGATEEGCTTEDGVESTPQSENADISSPEKPIDCQPAEALTTEPENSDTIDTTSDGTTEPERPEVVDLDREAFYLLPKELRALNDQVQELKWSRQHRVLFHEAWRQPILDKDNATSVIISAGEAYGEHFELEGTLSVNVSRYLHLHTNLWFSEFAHNYGQDKGEWPELPIRPDLRTYELTDSSALDETSLSPWDRVQPLSDEYDKILARPFIAERITLLKQKRRMRSKEIHYIDHPKVGLIILIEPYEIPDREEDTSENTEEFLTLAN